MFGKVKNKLALWWLKRKVQSLRGKERDTTMGKALKFLDGWKFVIGALALIGVKIYDQTQNGHAGDIVGAVLTVLGWMPNGDVTGDVARAVPALLMLWGLGHKLVKAQKQIRAGSSVTGVLSTEGYVKEYVEGVIKGDYDEDDEGVPVDKGEDK